MEKSLSPVLDELELSILRQVAVEVERLLLKFGDEYPTRFARISQLMNAYSIIEANQNSLRTVKADVEKIITP